MIRIHRSKPVVYVEGKPVKLTRREHLLLTVLGMMDNKLVAYDVLLDVVPDNLNALRLRVGRLKQKVGPDSLVCKREFGYILSGNVRFCG